MIHTQSHIDPAIRKIAVLRANAIGDLVFALPALDALRAAYPDAEIVLLGRRWHAEFLAGRNSPIDRVDIVPTSRGINTPPGMEDTVDENPRELSEFFSQQAREGYDLAIQLHGGGRYSNPFVRRLGARLTIGLKTPDAMPLDRWVPYIYFQPEILRYLEVVSLVGAIPVGLAPHLDVTGRDLAESRAAVPEGDRPLVVIHPGAGDPRRRWPADKFARVADKLAAAGGRVAVLGTCLERQLVDTVLSHMSSPAFDVCDRLSLGGLLGLLSRADLVISNDSGPLHLAEAAGVATVGIYWCGNMINAEPITRSTHRPVIAWRLDCPLCGRDTIHDNCEHHVSFVADLTEEEILRPAFDLLSAMAGVRTGKPGQATDASGARYA